MCTHKAADRTYVLYTVLCVGVLADITCDFLPGFPGLLHFFHHCKKTWSKGSLGTRLDYSMVLRQKTKIYCVGVDSNSVSISLQVAVVRRFLALVLESIVSR